jgi:hypothetical protein
VADYWDETLTPAPPCGGTSGVGETPYPLPGDADVLPKAPRGSAEGVGDSPYGEGRTDTEVLLPAGRHENTDFDMHRGSGLIADEKPGAFGGPYTD